MASRSYDIITVGGGIAASSLARAMAERGARVRRTPLRRTASAEFSCMPRDGEMVTHPLSRSLTGSGGIAGESPAADCRGSHTRS